MGRFWKDGNWAVVSAFAIFALLGLLMWFSYYYDFADVCAADESGQLARCAREWTSILVSGAGMAFAAGTIILLYRQNAEQKKQTDFLLGDSWPTMDVTIDPDDKELLIARIVNWNRRSLRIWDIDVFGIDGSSSMIFEYKYDGRKEKDYDSIFIEGWENRSKGPHVAKFKLCASVGSKIIGQWPFSTEVVAKIQVLDSSHKALELSSKLYMTDDYPPE